MEIDYPHLPIAPEVRRYAKAIGRRKNFEMGNNSATRNHVQSAIAECTAATYLRNLGYEVEIDSDYNWSYDLLVNKKYKIDVKSSKLRSNQEHPNDKYDCLRIPSGSTEERSLFSDKNVDCYMSVFVGARACFFPGMITKERFMDECTHFEKGLKLGKNYTVLYDQESISLSKLTRISESEIGVSDESNRR